MGISGKGGKTDMSNILGKDVIQLKSGISVETIESDEDYRMGRIAAKVANRVKIAWNDSNTYIYVNLDELDKVDNTLLRYNVPLSALSSGASGKTDNTDPQYITHVRYFEDKAPETDNTGLSHNVNNPDNKGTHVILGQ